MSANRRLAVTLVAASVLGIVTTSTSAPGAERETVIGAVYPMTGALAPTGVDLKRGIDMALEIINGKHDLNLPLARDAGLPRLGGAKIRVIYGDTQGSPDKGLSEAERLLTSEKAVALMGAYQSGVTLTSSQAAERLGIPYLNDSSSSPTLHQRGFKWYFRTSPHDEIFAQNFFAMFKGLEQRGARFKKIGIVWENTLYGKDVSTFDQKYAKAHGFEVVADVPYPPRTAQLFSEVQKLKASGVEVVMHAALVSDAILAVKTMKEQDLNLQAYVGHGAGFLDPAFVKTMGRDADYVFSWEVWGLDLANRKPLIKAVNDLYRQRYGINMNGTSARSFTGMLVLADAINRAGSTAPDKIREALLATDLPASQHVMPWPGVRFDPKTGQNVHATGTVVQILNGEYHTVWPPELAFREPVWPMPKWAERK